MNYKWLHIPTGKSGIKEVNYSDRNTFLEKLNDWNRQGNGDWVYFETHNPGYQIIPDDYEEIFRRR